LIFPPVYLKKFVVKSPIKKSPRMGSPGLVAPMPRAASTLLTRQIGKQLTLPQFLVPEQRTLAEIQGLVLGTAGVSASVRFAGCTTPELVPLKVMHQLYLHELLAFYEEHIVLVSVGEQDGEQGRNIAAQ
jgi:hypothetical protein